MRLSPRITLGKKSPAPQKQWHPIWRPGVEPGLAWEGRRWGWGKRSEALLPNIKAMERKAVSSP